VISVPQWAAERTVDAARAAELIGRVFPALRGLPVEPLSEGWDNTVHLVGGRWVFRFPRRTQALPGFRRELAVLPRLAGRLALRISAPELVGTDDDPEDPWPFSGARLLRGRELAEAALPDAARIAAAAAVGAFLAGLHRIDTEEFDLPLDTNQRAWPAARTEHTRAVLRSLAEAGTWTPDAAVAELLAEGERLPAPAGEPVLVHGDLHVRHLLVDGDGRAAGVIDWGDVCLADPAVDLGFAFAAFSGPAREALLGAYGPVDGDRELRARCLAVRLSAMLVDYAAAEGRPALLGESLAGLRRAVT
jgi:aminoglycoside phosphotransferase (APT) family kinase protein